MDKKKRVAVILLAVCMAAGFPMTASAQQYGYAYNYDYWGDIQYSPDPYSVIGVYTAGDLGLEQKFNVPQGMYVIPGSNQIYVCDTGNNRIVEIEREGTDSLKVVRIIDEIKGEVTEDGTPLVKTLSNPTDVFVTEDGYFYICDKGNNRVLKLDNDLNYLMEFVKPTDANFDQSLSFLPNKLTVDSAGRVFVIADNVNKGLIKYENDGTFSGFLGATAVTFSFSDYIWKRLATKEQRAQMESFVPTEYDNVYMDHDGFIYACTTNVSEVDLDDGSAKPIRRLNMMGSDILIENGNWYIIGDLYWGQAANYSGPSLMVDITAMENDVYFSLDKVRGRIFAYDNQGRLLYAFGGNGNMNGYFRAPIAIEHMGNDLLVLDSIDSSITLFTPTEFGSLIFQAIDEYAEGKYEESGETWRKVLVHNGNYDLAYIGIGRSLLRQEEYKEAMKYFELKWDTENYSKAFKQYRKIWVEDHIGWIFAAIAVLFFIPMGIGRIKKIKHEIDTADIFRE